MTRSVFSYVRRDQSGKIVDSPGFAGNLRTNAGIDWQANVMGATSAPPAQANWIALSSDVAAPAATDTVLASEFTTLGLSRAQATFAHTTGQTNFTLTKTFTATGTATVAKAAIFNASTSGTMVFEALEPSSASLTTNDTYSQTVQVNI